MKQTLLTLKTLPSYATGDLTKRFDELLAKQVKDCIERPGLDKIRTLTLKVTLRPKKKDDGSCDDCWSRSTSASRARASRCRAT